MITASKSYDNTCKAIYEETGDKSPLLTPAVERAMQEYAIACQEQLRRDCAELCKLPSDKQAILETPLIK